MLNAEKGNELYLEWLERNQDTVDMLNRKISLNMRANEQGLKFSNETSRASLRNNLVMRRYTTGASL